MGTVRVPLFVSYVLNFACWFLMWRTRCAKRHLILDNMPRLNKIMRPGSNFGLEVSQSCWTVPCGMSQARREHGGGKRCFVYKDKQVGTGWCCFCLVVNFFFVVFGGKTVSENFAYHVPHSVNQHTTSVQTLDLGIKQYISLINTVEGVVFHCMPVEARAQTAFRSWCSPSSVCSRNQIQVSGSHKQSC